MPRQKSSCLVSVILSACNDIKTLDRAISSVLEQTFTDWELLVVGAGSIDGLHEDLRPWTRQSRRIRPIEVVAPTDSGRCRSTGLNWACGEYIAHLDACDQYYPSHLEHVAQLCEESDVLMFGYDLVYANGTVGEHVAKRDPPTKGCVFALNPVSPLGMAHRRTIHEAVGGFHEMQLQHEDSVFWERLAKIGAKFMFVSLKAGLHYVTSSRAE